MKPTTSGAQMLAVQKLRSKNRTSTQNAISRYRKCQFILLQILESFWDVLFITYKNNTVEHDKLLVFLSPDTSFRHKFLFQSNCMAKMWYLHIVVFIVLHAFPPYTNTLYERACITKIITQCGKAYQFWKALGVQGPK